MYFLLPAPTMSMATNPHDQMVKNFLYDNSDNVIYHSEIKQVFTLHCISSSETNAISYSGNEENKWIETTWPFKRFSRKSFPSNVS